MERPESKFCEIEMLGSLRVRIQQVGLPRFKSQKAATLLALLALRLPDSESRERLAEAIWPETNPAASRNNLSVTLHALRALLEPEPQHKGRVLRSDSNSIGLHPESVWTDVGECREHLAAERFEEAIALYRGPLLPGFYAEAITLESERMQEDILRACERLYQHSIREGKFREAAAVAAKLVSFDSFVEQNYVRLIRAQRESGHSVEALETYRSLTRMLATTFDAEPSEDAKRLVQDLGDLVAKKPAHMPMTSASRNLPQRITRFFGRQKELELLQRLFEQGRRLITVSGLGGMGKTRLAEEALGRLQAESDRLIAFVSMASASVEQLPSRIAEALGAPPIFENQLGRSVRMASQGRTILLMLDNLEYSLSINPELVCELITGLLREVPELCILCTSRQTLGIEGEVDLRLEPLPSPHDKMGLEAARANPRIQLYVDRAQTARADFDLTEQNVVDITALCRWLEGVPLAIELAGACVRSLPPKAMLKRLDSRLALPSSTFRNVPARHRSIRAVLDTSYELLGQSERRALCCAAVFRESFDQAALANLLEPTDAKPALLNLISASLVESFTIKETERYRMLDLVKEYAEQRMVDEFDPDELKLRYAIYFLHVAQTLRPKMSGEDQERSLSILSLDSENCLGALDYLLDSPSHIDESLQLITALWRFWATKGLIAVGIPRLERALERCTQDQCNPSASALADALNVAGNIAYSNGDFVASITHHERALSLHRSQTNARGIAMVLNNLGLAYTRLSEYGRARACYVEAIAISSANDFDDMQAFNLGSLALTAAAEGSAAEAIPHFRSCIELFRKLGNRHGVANNLRHLALTLSDNGGHDEEVFRLMLEALDEATALEALPIQMGILESIAIVLLNEDRMDDAATLHHRVNGLRQEHGIAYGTGDRDLENRCAERLGDKAIGPLRSGSSVEDIVQMARDFLARS